MSRLSLNSYDCDRGPSVLLTTASQRKLQLTLSSASLEKILLPRRNSVGNGSAFGGTHTAVDGSNSDSVSNTSLVKRKNSTGCLMRRRSSGAMKMRFTGKIAKPVESPVGKTAHLKRTPLSRRDTPSAGLRNVPQLHISPENNSNTNNISSVSQDIITACGTSSPSASDKWTRHRQPRALACVIEEESEEEEEKEEA